MLQPSSRSALSNRRRKSLSGQGRDWRGIQRRQATSSLRCSSSPDPRAHGTRGARPPSV